MQRKHNYAVWANLNKEGMKKYGHVFKDGMVPVLIPIYQTAEFEGVEGVHAIHMINFNLIGEETKQKLFEFISSIHDAPIETIKDYVKENGMPIRSTYCSSIGVDPRFII